jgi:hypothetical protein
MNLSLRAYAILYRVLHGGAHYPQFGGTLNQGVVGDGLGSHDQVLEINSNILPLDLHGSRLNLILKTKLNINSSIDQCIEHITS